MVQQPSVGRVVHYVSHGTPVLSEGGQVFPSACRAAIVTEVTGQTSGEDGELVGLSVLNPGGLFFVRGSVHSELVHAGGTWHWPERV